MDHYAVMTNVHSTRDQSFFGGYYDITALLKALSDVESGSNDKAKGANGEVSRYQIMPRVYRDNGGKRNWWIHQQSKVVARRILDKRITAYRNMYGKYPSIETVYILWNCPAYKLHISLANKRPPAISLNTATRFKNIYDSLVQQF